MHLLALAGTEGVSYWPFGILGISVVFIIVMIAVLRVHAFLALILAAILVGMLAPQLPALAEVKGSENMSHWVKAVEYTMLGFGMTAGQIGIVIGLASIIGLCLMESGAADKIVRQFLKVLGEKRAGVALLASGFVLSIPVFFDTVFFLLIPLARALSLRSGKNYMLYVMAICGGGALTHSIVAPTPGPLLVAEILKVDLGLSIVTGFLAGILPAIGIWYLAKFLNSRVSVPVRETAGATLAELQAVVNKRDDQLPSFGLSILPVVLPVLLIAFTSFLGLAAPGPDPLEKSGIPAVVSAFGGADSFAVVSTVMGFLGNKNIALLIGTIIAMWLYARQSRLSLSALGDAMRGPLETAGLIILITSAGGAFGAMIRHSGVGESMKAVAEGAQLNYILLAWVVTAVIRIAQGSATVAMITTAGIIMSIIGDGSGLPYHPLYIFLAIGFGSMILSWMNDSGFWVVGKLSGFTERETLKSWTVVVTALSIMGLIETLIFASILPLPPGH